MSRRLQLMGSSIKTSAARNNEDQALWLPPYPRAAEQRDRLFEDSWLLSGLVRRKQPGVPSGDSEKPTIAGS